MSLIKSIINNLREYVTHVNLPGAGNPHKLSDGAKRRPVSEAFKGIYDHLEEIKDSAAEMGLLLWVFTSQTFTRRRHTGTQGAPTSSVTLKNTLV